MPPTWIEASGISDSDSDRQQQKSGISTRPCWGYSNAAKQGPSPPQTNQSRPWNLLSDSITGLARHYMSLYVIIGHYIIWHGLRIMAYNDTISCVIIQCTYNDTMCHYIMCIYFTPFSCYDIICHYQSSLLLLYALYTIIPLYGIIYHYMSL